jgi:intracellular septation protein A
MWQDRKTLVSLNCLMLATLFIFFGTIGLYFHDSLAIEIQNISTVLIVAITLLLGQGYAHQINLILKSGQTGALNIKMSQYILLMDISTIAFGLSLGIDNSWPLLLLASVSGITKVIIMYLFRWVRVNSKAKQLRLENN